MQISMRLHAQLIALAAADRAHEVCGLLLGRGDHIEVLVEARNVAADPARTFEIDPRVLIDQMKAARAGGLPMIGCYHSHPRGSAIFSARDSELAATGSLWLIIADRDIRAWRRDEGDFVSVELKLIAD